MNEPSYRQRDVTIAVGWQLCNWQSYSRRQLRLPHQRRWPVDFEPHQQRRQDLYRQLLWSQLNRPGFCGAVRYR